MKYDIGLEAFGKRLDFVSVFQRVFALFKISLI